MAFLSGLFIYTRSEFSPVEKILCCLWWICHIVHHVLSSYHTAGTKLSAAESKTTRPVACPKELRATTTDKEATIRKQ